MLVKFIIIFADFRQRVIFTDLEQFCRQGWVKKLTKKYSQVTNLFCLRTINLFTVHFVYNFHHFKYLINKRQRSAVIICAIPTTRIKLISLFFFMMKTSNLAGVAVLIFAKPLSYFLTKTYFSSKSGLCLKLAIKQSNQCCF